MPTRSEQALRDFQVSLSEKGQARVRPEVATEVFSTIAAQDDMSASAMARKANCHRKSANLYVRGEQSPPFNKFVRLVERLGYSVHLVKNGVQ